MKFNLIWIIIAIAVNIIWHNLIIQQGLNLVIYGYVIYLSKNKYITIDSFILSCEKVMF